VSNVVTYFAYVTLDPDAALVQVKPGMTASVQVIVNHADGVVYLPTSAVSARGTTATVDVATGTDLNKTTPTAITLGLRGDSSVVVTSGLKAGDKVVIVRQATAAGAAAGAGAGAGAARVGARVGG
jgi:macrolide-specific efflux system membrane fusion protein